MRPRLYPDSHHLDYHCVDESVPPDVAARVAACAGVTPEHLACVTLEESSHELQGVLLHYCELYARHRDDTTPLVIKSVRRSGGGGGAWGCRPFPVAGSGRTGTGTGSFSSPSSSRRSRLFRRRSRSPSLSPSRSRSRSRSRFRSRSRSRSRSNTDPYASMDSDAKSDYDEDEREGLTWLHGLEHMPDDQKRRVLGKLFRYANGHREDRASQAEYTLGHGQVVVLWPPPPPLAARTLAKQALDKHMAADPGAARRYVLLPDVPDADSVDKAFWRTAGSKRKGKGKAKTNGKEEKKKDVVVHGGWSGAGNEEEEGRKDSRRKGKEGNGTDHHHDETPVDVHKYFASALGASDEANDGGGERKKGNSENESEVTTTRAGGEYGVFFVARYDVWAEEDGRVVRGRRVSVLCAAGGNSVVRDFLQGLLQWDVERRPVALPVGRRRERREPLLSLLRYKLKPDGRGYWEREGDRRSRRAGSVILAGRQMDDILSDLRQFLGQDTRAWYTKHGLPRRWSYLFYGPPGTGKTSTIRVLASKFGLDCCFLNMANGSFSNQDLADALESLPDRPLLVIEDADALFTNRRSDVAKSLTFSGLLNALDGVLSVDGVVTVLTTNHRDRLDDALLRAGRVDRSFYFGHPDLDCVRRLFLSFYPSAPDATARAFADSVWQVPDTTNARNFASLQQLFIMHRLQSADECVRQVRNFFDTYFPDGVDERRNALARGKQEEGEEKAERRRRRASGPARSYASDDDDKGDDNSAGESVEERGRAWKNAK